MADDKISQGLFIFQQVQMGDPPSKIKFIQIRGGFQFNGPVKIIKAFAYFSLELLITPLR